MVTYNFVSVYIFRDCRIHNCYIIEDRVALYAGLDGARDVASAIIFHEHT